MAKPLSEEQTAIVRQYGHMFNNTGGNDIVEICNRQGLDFFSNPLACSIQTSCWSQVYLIQQMKKEGMLNENT